MKLGKHTDLFQVNIIQNNYKVFDKIYVPNPLSQIKPKMFIEKSYRSLEIESKTHPNTKYIFTIEWNEIGMNYRESQKLAKERSQLNKKLNTLEL